MMARPGRGDRLEIKDYVRALEGKGRIVAAVAILAGFLAAVIFIFEPQPYHATASVPLPVPPSTTTSALAAVSEAYADFSGAITTDVVAQRAATDVGVPASAVKGHVEVSRLAGGQVAEVVYTGTDQGHASAIAKAAATEALALIVSARLDPLDQQQQLAQAAYDDANSQYQQFISDTLILNPTKYFNTQQQRFIALQDAIGNARGLGDDAKATALQARLDAKKAEVSQQAADYNRIIALRDSSKEALAQAQLSELGEKGLLTSVKAGNLVSVTEPTGSSRLTGLIKAVVPAVVVATGLAIALIVLLEVVGPARLPIRQRAAGPGQHAPDGRDIRAAPRPAPRVDEDEDEEPPRDPAGRVLRTRT
jgi:hypothetical protein